MKLNTLEGKIKSILENNEQARADDMLLYVNYIYFELGKHASKDAETWLMEIFTNRRLRVMFGISGTESVRRCRQKLQERYPHLRPSKEMLRIRKEEEKRYKAYARGEE